MNLNVQNSKQFSQNIVPNTYIGGIAKQGGTGVNAPIDTPYKLSTKLNINVNRIEGFRIVGYDVDFKNKGAYSVNENVFQNNTNINSFLDYDKLVTSFSNGSFQNCVNLEFFEAEGITNFTTGGNIKFSNTKVKHLYFPSVVNLTGAMGMGNNTFVNNSYLETFIMPNAREHPTAGGNSWLIGSPNMTLIDFRSMRFIGRTHIGVNMNRGNNFFGTTGSNTNGVLKVHQNCTYVDVDAGPDVNMMVLYDRGWTVELYDDNGNYVSTL